jgi:hypothetical protein
VTNDLLLRDAVWQGLTIRDLVCAAMVDRPQQPCLIDHGIDGRVHRFNARMLDHIATRIARRFATAGAKQGDAILIALPNGAPAFLAMLGALGAGLKPCLISPMLDDAAISLVLQRLKPRALVSAAYDHFDPLRRFINEARRLAMPLYVWNFGPCDDECAAPLSDLFDGQAPQRMAPLHPPQQGYGPVVTVTDFGNGPEPVTHSQDQLLAQAILAQMAHRGPREQRIVSAVSLASQAGLVLGPLRALLAGAELNLIADPSADAFRDAAAGSPASWILPAPLAHRLRDHFHTKDDTLITLYRAGQNMFRPSDETGMIAFGEALTLPLMRADGQPLAPGTIMANVSGTAMRFATLSLALDHEFILDSPLAGRRLDGEPAHHPLIASLAKDGRFARFIITPQEKRHALV